MAEFSSTGRSALIADVRTFANLLDQTPDLPAPRYVDVLVFPDEVSEEAARAEIDRISALLGTPVEDDAGHYRTIKTLGRVTYRAVAITADARHRWDALMSYRDAITPADDPISAQLSDALGRSCRCGARIDDGPASCGKCAARSRWQRRKSRNASKDRARGDGPCS
ncbi:hypothetical protein J5X84_40385 [Streptosporangiaceae bacterium NEAU-GS5]|nr:hypothetical protein [Streptosporangiaceae bacterium NEAU-GS5]